MKVSEIMTRQVEIAALDDTIEQVAQRMAQTDTGALPVGENDKLVGIITDRDIAVRVAAQGKDPRSAKVRDAMTAEIKYCYEDEDLDHVVRNMGDVKLRRLPVMNREKRLIGIISLGDIAVEAGGRTSGDALKRVSEPGRPHSQAEQAYAGSKPQRG